jgi:hypothetical protein
MTLRLTQTLTEISTKNLPVTGIVITSFYFTFAFSTTQTTIKHKHKQRRGASGSVLVEALEYKLEDRGFETR